jgi:hypothetical protein
MKLFLTLFIVSAMSFCLTTTIFGQDEILTNDEVISLSKAGLSNSVIIDKIRGSKTNFDLTTDGLIRLKRAGISDDIVSAMLSAKTGAPLSRGNSVSQSNNPASGDPNDPMSQHDVGIYLYTETNGVKKMTEMESNVVTQSRAGGMFGTAMTYGILKTKVKAKVPGITANLQISEAKPTFYFYLNEKDRTMSTVKYFPSSVNQFQLIQFHVKDKGREVTVGKVNAFGGKYGISDEYLVEFSFEKIQDGVYKVTPKAALINGEYGFYLLGTGEGTGATFFDFGVRLVP